MRNPLRETLPGILRRWLAGHRCYLHWLILIEEVLFGDNPAYAGWRARLRAAHRATSEVSGAPSSTNKSNEKLNLILSNLSSQIDQIKRQGITEAALRAIAARIEIRLRNEPVEEALRYIDNFVSAAVQEEKERSKDVDKFPDLVALRNEARGLLNAGRLAEVSTPFDAALQQRRDTQAERTIKEVQREVQLLQEAANYDCLAFDIEKAIQRHIEVAVLLSPDDVTGQKSYLYEVAHESILFGRNRTNQASLHLSIGIFQSVLQGVDEFSSPIEWASLVYSLGLSLARLGEMEAGTSRLEEAVNCYRDSLGHCSSKLNPYNWGLMQCYLGEALTTCGSRHTGSRKLRQAVTALKKALTVLTLTMPHSNGR